MSLPLCVCVLKALPSAHWSFKVSGFRQQTEPGSETDKGCVKRTKEGEETHLSSPRLLGSELLWVGDGSESQLTAWGRCVSPASLCRWVWTYLNTLGQDLSEELLREHAAHKPGITSNTGAEAEPALCGS